MVTCHFIFKTSEFFLELNNKESVWMKIWYADG